MTAVSTFDSNLQSALSLCADALRGMANYQLAPSLDRRLQKMSERKEFLSTEEHEELLALVSFARERTIEKLRAELALRRLQEVCPEVAVE